jgi:dienelactone hydrolase
MSPPLFPGPISDFERITDLPLETLRIGPAAGRGVVVLHELPGLTKDDLGLARALGQRGFNVFAPLLFGQPEDQSTLGGFRAACRSGLFECSRLSARHAIQDKLEPLCKEIASRTGNPIAAVGMCLTGILPLALVNHGVAAPVLCQPTLPFSVLAQRPTGDQKRDMGLDRKALEAAIEAQVPFLLLHYKGDDRCPPERVDEVRRAFKQQAATIDLEGNHHSSLAGDFDRTAFDDAVDYIKVRLGVEPGPRAMRLAALGVSGTRCQIGVDRVWHPA